ncbi:hypothetical protein LCGC14_2040530 [marine sediment metagenome]|uniref:Uncharacterized protein n=1 Tax=marine sediment metagenome TaxID=412755 RepID=A0A0F9H5H6_9ZZZZ
MANNMAKYKEPEKKEEVELDENKYIQVPIERLNEKEEPIREFKTYKIVKRLDYGNENPKQDTTEIFNLLETLDDEFDSLERTEALKPNLPELRQQSPALSDYKYINE